MKKRIIAVLFSLALLTAPGYSQEEEQARDLFRTYATTSAKGRPGARIRIELLRNGSRQFVPLDTVFRSGDKVKLYFEVNFPAYVEIYNQGSSGAIERLFPYEGTNSRVRVTSAYTVPLKATEWFEFDETPGTEKLAFIFSRVQLRPVAKPQPEKQPAKQPGIAVNPGSQGNGNAEQQAITDLQTRALEEGRDLNRVQVKDEHYIFSTPQRLQRAVGVLIELEHRQ